MRCPNCDSKVADTATFCPACSTRIEKVTEPKHDLYKETTIKPVSMKWYNALMVLMIIGGVGAIIMAVWTLFSKGDTNIYFLYPFGMYGISEEATNVYRRLVVCGALLDIGVAVFLLYVRNRLVDFRANGPKLLLQYYIISTSVSVAFTIFCNLRMGELFRNNPFVVYTPSYGTIVVDIIWAVIMYCTNKVYFEKRAHLFIK